MNVNDILIKPVVTEKTTVLQQENKYVFKINAKATKNSVKEAMKKLYKVEPIAVNIMIVPRKKKGIRFRNGITPGWKKAIVTLKSSDKLDLFEATK